MADSSPTDFPRCASRRGDEQCLLARHHASRHRSLHDAWSDDEWSPAERAEFEAARLDPTSDRDRWDLFGPDADGGLERPGDGDEW